MNPLAAILLLIAVSVSARADSWAAPEVRVITSPDQSGLVRIHPGRANQRASAIVMRFDPKAREYRKIAEFALRNPSAPHAAVISDGATFLVTFDDWGQIGRTENVIVVYRGTGEFVRAWHLEDLFSPAESATFLQSVSSTWWRGDVRVLAAGGSSPTIEILTARGVGAPAPLFKGRTPDYPFYLEVGTQVFRK